jgi:hypothetical protein
VKVHECRKKNLEGSGGNPCAIIPIFLRRLRGMTCEVIDSLVEFRTSNKLSSNRSSLISSRIYHGNVSLFFFWKQVYFHKF